MSSLTSLPHIQMLGKIMRYLPLEDHLNFPKVCKSWYKYSSNNDFKLESNIRDIWKSYLACEMLLNKLLNPNYDRKYFRIHIINNDICVLGKSSFYNIANMWLLFKTYAWANKKELLWMSNPDNERLKLMNQKNLEIMQGQHDYEGEIAYRPKNYGNLKDFDGNANFDYRFIKWLSTSITMATQCYNLYNFVKECKQVWNQAPDKVNEKIIDRLSYPNELEQDPILKHFKCTLSQRIPLLPVIDKCGHFFDYVFIKHHIKKTVQCPVRNQRLLFTDLSFDKETFLTIQNRLRSLKNARSPLVKDLHYLTFNSEN